MSMAKTSGAERSSCPECSAAWEAAITCRDHFHHMLFWENDVPARGEVHHLMVLCYHLQHPSLYSAAGLAYARGLLDEFVVRGQNPQAVRRRNRPQVDSGRRDWSITARPGDHGAYEPPVTWTMTAADVVAGGAENYVENVRTWARAIHHDIHHSAIDR